MVLEKIIPGLAEKRQRAELVTAGHERFISAFTEQRKILLTLSGEMPEDTEAQIVSDEERHHLDQVKIVAEKLLKNKKYRKSFLIFAQKFSLGLAAEATAALEQLDQKDSEKTDRGVILDSLFNTVWLLVDLRPKGISRRRFLKVLAAGAFLGAAYTQVKTMQHPALLEEVVAAGEREKRGTEGDTEVFYGFDREKAEEYLFNVLFERGVRFHSDTLHDITVYIYHLIRLYRNDENFSQKTGDEAFKFFVDSLVQKSEEVEIPLHTLFMLIKIGCNNYLRINKFEYRVQEAVNDDIAIYRKQLGIRVATQLFGIPEEEILYEMTVNDGMRYKVLKWLADTITTIESTEVFGQKYELKDLRKKLSHFQHIDGVSDTYFPLVVGRLIDQNTQTFFDMES